VIGAELQGNMTELDFEDTFKIGRAVENGAYIQKGTTSRVMMASRLEVNSDQMAAPIPEIMDRN
jgi:hypothetical protein